MFLVATAIKNLRRRQALKAHVDQELWRRSSIVLYRLQSFHEWYFTGLSKYNPAF